MASYTPNLNLYKPDDSDDYEDFREGFNGNMNILDQGGNANQNIAEDYDDTATYAVGDYVIYNGLLYKCDTAVTTAETFDPTKWTHVVVTDEMGSGGGGSGDTVTWNQIQQSGTKIAEIDINGTTQDVYAPQGGGSGGHTIYDKDGNSLAQESGLQFTGAVVVSDDSVNGRTVVDVEGGGNYYLNTLYSTEEKKIGYWTDGKPLYQRVWDFGSDLVIPNGSFYTTNIDSSNFETIVEGFGIYSTGVTRYNLMVNTNGTNIRLQADRMNGSANVRYLVLQYTKTTDTADPNPQFGNVIYLPTIYSEEERQVGVYTDGKPLYQKTYVQHSTDARGNYINFDVSALNIDTCVSLKGTCDRIVPNVGILIYEFNSYENGTYYTYLSYSKFNEVVQYIVRFNYGGGESTSFQIITIQYTKTTDTAGSGDWTPSGELAHHYSTNEQVVGTWIDGKPLYQKVFTGLSQPTNGDNWVTINGVTIPNIREVISLNAFSVGGSGNMIKVALAEYSRNNNGDGVQVSVVSSAFNRTINTAVVQYTKTTD